MGHAPAWKLPEGDDTGDGAGFVLSSAQTPGEIDSSAEWYAAPGEGRPKVKVKVALTTKGEYKTTFENLRLKRSQKQGGSTTTLSNGLPMPLLGLGTGGVMEIKRVATEAMDMGYA